MSDPHLLRPDHHPTPFSAAEIRAGNQPGRTIRQLIEVEGSAPVMRFQQWVTGDDERGTGVVATMEPDGSLRDVQRTESTWLELQGHASMPIATTTIDEVTIDSPMGPLECLRYTRVDGDDVMTFWFARRFPGMPVRTERSEHGRVVERATVLANDIEPIVNG